MLHSSEKRRKLLADAVLLDDNLLCLDVRGTLWFDIRVESHDERLTIHFSTGNDIPVRTCNSGYGLVHQAGLVERKF